MRCEHCRAETTNGLALCELCQRAVVTYLTYLPIYFRNLARWRPGRAGSRPVPGSRVLYDGEVRGKGDKIEVAVEEAANAFATWAKALVNDRPEFPRPLTMADAALVGDLPEEMADDQALVVTWLCVAFERHLTSIATLGWCGEFVRQLAEHEETLRGLTETVVPGWYAGACKRCESGTYVVPGLTWVTCRGCGTTTYARDHLETVLDEARDWIARPKDIAKAIVALVDTELSVTRLHKRIAKWGERGRIQSHRRTVRGYEWDAVEERMVVAPEETGHARYRLGEVLDRLYSEGATRLSDATVKAS